MLIEKAKLSKRPTKMPWKCEGSNYRRGLMKTTSTFFALSLVFCIVGLFLHSHIVIAGPLPPPPPANPGNSTQEETNTNTTIECKIQFGLNKVCSIDNWGIVTVGSLLYDGGEKYGSVKLTTIPSNNRSQLCQQTGSGCKDLKVEFYDASGNPVKSNYFGYFYTFVMHKKVSDITHHNICHRSSYTYGQAKDLFGGTNSYSVQAGKYERTVAISLANEAFDTYYFSTCP